MSTQNMEPRTEKNYEVPVVTKPVNNSITTRTLNLWYGDFQALKDVTINIRQGIITGLPERATKTGPTRFTDCRPGITGSTRSPPATDI